MGEIRIVSGRYRARLIKTPEGQTTRPLLTRLRKSLADILRPRLQGATVLDLFGGSGAIAFELLSNGAEHAVVTEMDRSASLAIRANAIRLKADMEVILGDCLHEIPKLRNAAKRFDLIIIAPPYNQGLQEKVMDSLVLHHLLAEGGLIVVQRDSREPQWQPRAPYVLARERSYGRTVFDFYEAER